jgi:hypothetical protein
MRKRAMALIAQTPFTPETHPALCALADYCAQSPGLDFRNYASGPADRQGRTAYNQEARSILRDWQRFQDLFREAASLVLTDADIVAAAPRAFSGRLEWKNGQWEYCTGQYWPTEYRKAGAAVLNQAIHTRRQSEKHTLPEKEYSLDEIKAAAKRSGSYFFDNARRGERITKLKGNRLKVTTPNAYSNGGTRVAFFRFNPEDVSFKFENAE